MNRWPIITHCQRVIFPCNKFLIQYDVLEDGNSSEQTHFNTQAFVEARVIIVNIENVIHDGIFIL